MRRYLIASMLIGMASFGSVFLLHSAGFYDGSVNWLQRAYNATDLFPLIQFGALQVRWLWMETGILLISAFGLAWCVTDIAQVGQKILIFLTSFIVVLCLSLTLALYGVIFPPFTALTAASISMVIGLIYAGTEKGMRKRVLQNVLGARVSKETFSRLINSPETVPLEGGTYEASVLTCRLFNHSALKKEMKANELIALTNRFLHNTADFLMSRGAYLDESSPDCVRVFFGLLTSGTDHAQQACQAALELKQRLGNLDAECESRWFHKPLHGMAISSGEMTVGVYGSPRHYYFSGVGLITDFSRRIGDMNQIYGSDVMVSARTFQLASENIEVRPMEMVYDPESRIMTEVYELMALSDGFSEAERRSRDVFWEAMILYREKNYEKALEKFYQIEKSEKAKEDLPLKFFISLTQECLAHGEPESGINGSMRKIGHARLLNTL